MTISRSLFLLLILSLALVLGGCGQNALTPGPLATSTMITGSAFASPTTTAPLTGTTAASTATSMLPQVTTAPPALATNAAGSARETPTEPTLTGTATASTPPSATTPEEVVRGFYNWYTTYQGNPLTTQAFASSQYLTTNLISKVANQLASSSHGIPADPFICAQNMPSSFTVGKAVTTDDHATVNVQMQYSAGTPPGTVRVILVQQNGQWAIDNVACSPGQ